KEILFYYKYYLGKKYNSTALITDAWHHRSDSLSSLAALLGIGGAMLGAYVLLDILIYSDSASGIIGSIVVLKFGDQLAKESYLLVMEKVLDSEEIKVYAETVNNVSGVLRIDQIYARTHGSYIIIDIKISVDPDIKVREGHD